MPRSPQRDAILITFENEVKIMRNCLIINVMFIQNDTLWVISVEKTKDIRILIYYFRVFKVITYDEIKRYTKYNSR